MVEWSRSFRSRGPRFDTSLSGDVSSTVIAKMGHFVKLLQDDHEKNNDLMLNF